MAKTILIVDDEPSLIKGLRFNLEQQEGYEVDAATDGEAALQLFEPEKYDLVLLDLMLPKLDGMEVCQRIRAASDVPIIMLTAKGDTIDKVLGLELGADDYIVKPFSMPILLRKVAAVLRRTGGGTGVSHVIRYRGLTLDPDMMEARLEGRPLELTAREFELLRAFISSPGRVFTREVLLAKIWGYDFFGDERVVDSHIKNLRRKLGVDYIETVRGVGYRAAKENP